MSEDNCPYYKTGCMQSCQKRNLLIPYGFCNVYNKFKREELEALREKALNDFDTEITEAVIKRVKIMHNLEHNIQSEEDLDRIRESGL